MLSKPSRTGKGAYSRDHHPVDSDLLRIIPVPVFKSIFGRSDEESLNCERFRDPKVAEVSERDFLFRNFSECMFSLWKSTTGRLPNAYPMDVP